MKTVPALNFHDFSSSITGKASKINKYRIVPVILAKEQIQDYGVWELTDFLRNQLDPNLEVVQIFKSFETLRDSIKGVKQIPISFDHQGFITDESDWRIEGWVYKLVADEKRRLIRGTARISTLHLTDAQIFLLDEGAAIDVSIGGTAIFGDGCITCNPPYQFEQDKIHLNHLAILWNDKGRCDTETCGLNMDSVEGNKNHENRVHICGFNDKIMQPVFEIKNSLLNTNDNYNISNTLKREKNMPTELENMYALLQTKFADLRVSTSKDIDKLTIERDTAMNNATKKCESNKKLLKTIEDQKLSLKTHEDEKVESFVKFFTDKKLMTKDEVMKYTSKQLKEKQEWAEKITASIEDKSIEKNGLPKPKFEDRGNKDGKKDLQVSSIPAFNKKKEDDK